MGLAAQIREGSGKHTKEPGISQSTGKPSRSTHRDSLVSKKMNTTTIAAGKTGSAMQLKVIYLSLSAASFLGFLACLIM